MIAFYSVLFISVFFFSLLIKWKRKWFYALAERSVALVNDLLSDLKNDDKAKQVSTGTMKLLGALGRVFGLIIIASVIGTIPIFIHHYFFHAKYSDFEFTTWISALVVSASTTLVYFIPIRPTRSEYSELSQLFHRMVLNNFFIGEKLFKREVKKIRKKGIKPKTEFVVVTGLARAGTTSLMNDLSYHEKLVSLSYASMPFLMSPNLWKRFYKPKNSNLKERSHKDGILIGLHSNEALEEYFFKVKTHDRYIESDHLVKHEIDDSTYRDYLNYQRVICCDGDKIYLAKNNNFLLRYESIRTYNRDFLTLILFRNPLSHAASLLEKHTEYIQLQEKDPFILEYMNWLGHHEFGQGHKPFCFDEQFEAEVPKTSLDYWLKIWINYYRYALTLDHPNTVFINYGEFCQRPNELIRSLGEKIGIDYKNFEKEPYSNERKVAHQYNKKLADEALALYEQLINHVR